MRTGAIFARGSCRALKWVALVGVVLALGVGSAAAQVPPTDFDVVPTSDASNSSAGSVMRLTWSQPASGIAVVGYRWSSDGGGTWQTGLATNPGARTVDTPSALTAGQSYVFVLQAIYNVNGTTTYEEAPRVTRQAIGTPNAPTVTAAPSSVATGGGEVELSWTATSNSMQPIDSYRYRHYLTSAGSAAASEWAVGSSPVKVGGLQNGGPYTFEVQAVNLAGETSGTGTATPLKTPSEPQNLRTSTLIAGQVVLSWDPPSDYGGTGIVIAGYRYRVDDGQGGPMGAWKDPSPVTATTATESGLTPHRRYRFEVQARNSGGEGGIAFTYAMPTGAPQVPLAPQGLTSTAGDGSVELSWSAPSNNGGAAIERYDYEVNGSWTPSPNGSALSVMVGGLTNGTLYTFRVRAVNSAGEGEPSMSVQATPLGRPGMPQSLVPRAGDGQVTLSWTAPATGGAPTGYEVRSSVDGRSSDWAPAASMTGHTVMGLTNGTEYTFEVRATNDAGPGPAASTTATPTAAPTAPGVPQSLTASAGDGRVTLSWTAPATGSAPTAYDYRVIGAGVEGGWRYTDNGTGTEQTVSDLTNGTEYTFEVRAWHGALASAAASVKARPMAPDPGAQVTVKEVQAATSVAESGGLDVTVVATVPAGTKGADDKVAPIAMRTVNVRFLVVDDAIAARDRAEPEDTTLLGSRTSTTYSWEKITRTDKDSEQTFKFRVAIGQDLDAEDEQFRVEVTINGDPQKSKVVTIDDAEEQKFVLTLTSDHKEKNTIEEGDSGTLKLEADPDKTVSLPIELVLTPADASKYTLNPTSATLAAKGSVTSTVSAEADGDREEDTITVTAYTSGTLGNDVMLAELEITVADINALPAVEAMIVDDKGKALDPQPESVMEGETVEVMLTVVDKDGKALAAPEDLSVSLMPSSGSSADYRLSTHPIMIEKGKKSSAAVELMLEMDDDIGMEMLVFDASVAGDAKIGTDTRAVNNVLSLAIEDGTQKLVYAKTEEEVQAAIYAAKEAGAGDDMTFTPGEMIEVIGNDLFSAAEGVTLTYTAESDMTGVASTSVGGGKVMVTAVGEGMAHITITAHASMPSGAKPLPQTDPREASVIFPVEVGLEALSIMLSGPEDMNVAEGMSAMVTATANRAATEDVTVMLMRDREMSSAGDADFMAEPIVIEAGEMMGSTMVMAVEDNMMEDMEELVLYGMTEGMAGEVTGEVKLYLWDAAVPALPVIAQLLLAAFLAVGGYRRYRRR